MLAGVEFSGIAQALVAIMITGFVGAWLVFGIRWMRRKIKEL
jgi:uncharacterized membrane protein YciS (DUF1049 family)